MIHSFSLDDSTQLQLRRALRDSLPWIPSGHLCEAISAGLDFRSHAALKAAAKNVFPGQRRFAYFSHPQFCRHLWEYGYDTSNAQGKGLRDFVAPLHGALPYAHRAGGPEWNAHGPLIVYVPPRRLVECCKLVLREVQTHSDANYREPLGQEAHSQYEREYRTFFQPGTLLEAVDEMGIGRTVEEGNNEIRYNFTSAAFIAGIEAAHRRYDGLKWVGQVLADKSVPFESLWASDAALKPVLA